MENLQDLLNELIHDINYCKVSYYNDTEIDNANKTLLNVEMLVEKLTLTDSVKPYYCADESYHKIDRCKKQCGGCKEYKNKFGS